MKKILVVDDEAHIRQLYKDELEDEGYDVLLAASGGEALKTIEREHIDLVMLDIKMPDVNGLEILGKIKEINENLPVILVSAYDTYKQDFTSWVAEDYIVKSSDLNEIKEKVKKFIEV
ncbi:MAG: response regulator [bacterium]